jgi:hypothetical protein
MADRSVRRLCWAVVAGCLLASSAVWLAGAAAAGRAAGSSSGPGWLSVVGARRGPALRVLQFNLCDSGIAGCFTGRSVSVAAAVIRSERPDVVTLNEVCRDDVSALGRAMSEANGGNAVASAFKAAVDRRTGGPFRCLNGQQYGIGVLALRDSARSAYSIYGGIYPSQDLADPEERVWLCVELRGGVFACTTHTASTSATAALAQCRFLFSSALPMVRRRRSGAAPIILGADLNLRADRSPGPQSCLPAGYQRVDDGSLQDVVASPGVTLRSRTVIDMQGATDHPGLLVELTLP